MFAETFRCDNLLQKKTARQPAEPSSVECVLVF
jgi:hypothetical protein